MGDKKPNDSPSLFKRVVQEDDASGDLKTLFTIDLSTYDTSQMEGYVAGNKVYTGYTCKLATLKPMKNRPKSRIDIDPSNQEIRKAINDMYSAYDKLIASVK